MNDDDPREIGSLLTNAILRSLERAPIRMRESGVTHAGWRMEISSDQGSGSIMLVELPDGRSVHRGDGMFLGWPQEQLEATYAAMREVPDEPRFELHQLG
ncbi:MAG TPA: hypothetical protein VF713_14370 [Thermoanaerobaculia bacterium]